MMERQLSQPHRLPRDGGVPTLVSHHAEDAVGLRGVQQELALLGVGAGGLFDEDVLARGHALQGDAGHQGVAHHDADGVQLHLVQHLTIVDEAPGHLVALRRGQQPPLVQLCHGLQGDLLDAV